MTTTESPDQYLDDTNARRIGYSILFLVFGVFGSWSCLAPIDSAAHASGVVTVQGFRKTVQHLEGGIVQELKVRDGQQVREGDILLVLDTSQLQAEREVLINKKMATSALLARLQSELTSTKDSPKAESSLDGIRAKEAWQREIALLRARSNAREGERLILKQTIHQLEAQIQGLRSIVSNKQKLANSHRDEAEELRPLLVNGFIEKQRLRDQERAIERLSAEIAEHESDMSQAQQRINELKLQIMQIDKSFINEATTQLVATQNQSFEINEHLRSIEDRLQRSIIRAPASGMVLGLNVHTLGAVIGAGQPILDIVPTRSELIIEARINPNDIDQVAIGKNADIRFSSFNSATTPVIEGTLTQISADRLIDQASGQSYYLGRVAITERGQLDLKNHPLVPGMPADVLIKTGSRTLLSYLIKPASNWMARSFRED